MKKTLFPIMALVLAVGLALPMATPVTITAADGNLVVNGGFETPVITDYPSFCGNKNWQIFGTGGNGVNTTSLGWTVVASENATAGSYSWTAGGPGALELQNASCIPWAPYHGNQYAELDADVDGPCGTYSGEKGSVRIYQDITTVLGGTYQLSFAFSPRPNVQDNKLEVIWGGTPIDTLSADGTNPSEKKWTLHTYDVTATSSTTRLEFADKSVPDALGTFLDAVSVTPKPGSITVVKVVEGASPSDNWTFTGTNPIGSFTLSAAGGEQTFSSLTPGQYTITETTKLGYSISVSCNTGESGTNSVTFTLDPGESVTATFTNTKLGSVSGYKWADCNENAERGQDEVGLIGWEIKLCNKEGDNWVPHSSTTTGPDGTYEFTGLPPGEYKVEEVFQSGWVQTYPTTIHSFTLQIGESKTDVNFGNHSTGGSICANEVMAFSQGTKKGGGTITDPDRTDPNQALGPPDSMDGSVPTFFSLGYGGWIILGFPHSISGAITVYETTWGGPHGPETVEVWGSQDGTNWDYIGIADNNNGFDNGTGYGVNTHPTTLTLPSPIKYVKLVDTTSTSTNSDDAFDVDAVCGQYACGCIVSGHKYLCDAETHECTQTGLGGWTITLEDGQGAMQTVITGSDGSYQFIGLSDGNYTVSETLQDGWTNCTPTSYQLTLDENCQIHGQGAIVSDTNTLVTQGNGTTPHNAVYAWEPGPDYPHDGPDDSTWAANSLWDSSLTGHSFSASGADWIWESYRVVNPVAGDVVTFERSFYIPGNPTGGTLYITCDNGYEVYINGTFIGSAQVHDVSSTQWEDSDLTEPYVDTDHWQSVESYSGLTLLQGNNLLEIKTANEYMGPDDGQDNGTVGSNPAGLIYELHYGFDATEINFCNRETIPDISIIKTADPTQGAPSTNVTFTITVTNTGEVNLNPVQVVDTLPSGMSYVAAGTSPAPDDVTGNVITWNNVGPLAKSGDPDDSTTITLIVHIDPGDPATLINNVTATGTPPTGDPVSDTDTADVIRLAPGIDVTKTANPAQGAPSTDVTFTITITNTGEVALDPVQVVDTLPSGMSYVAAGTSPAPSSIVGNVITWDNVGPLAKSGDPNDSTTITLIAHIDSGDPATLINNVTATGTPPTGDPVSDTGTADVIRLAPGIDVTKTANPAQGAPSTDVTFTITVTNTGEVVLNTVQVVDTLPSGMSYVAAGTSPAPDDVTGNVITWNNVGPLAKSGDPGASTIITLIAHIDDGSGGVLTDNVTATGTPPAGAPVSNTATADVTRLAPGIDVTKTADPTQGAPSTNVTFTIDVTNTGDCQLNPVQVVDTLPSGMSYVAAGTSPAPDDVTGNVITWNNVGPLAKSGDPGASTIITLIAHIDAGASVTLTDNVTATGTPPTGDPVSGTGTASVTVTSGGGGGGGGGSWGSISSATAACPLSVTVNMLGEMTTARMTSKGVLCEDCLASDPTGQNSWEAKEGTQLLCAGNIPPQLIELTLAGSPPPPINAAIVGPIYDFTAYTSKYNPSPLTISPEATLALAYDPNKQPENISALTIAYYDENAGKWVEMETAGYVAGGVEVPNVLATHMTHLTYFAVLAKLTAPTPAKFKVSNLTVSPSQAQLNQEVAISVNVANTGGISGSYSLELTVNGISKSTKQVTVAAGTSQTVNFTITGDAAGKNQVEVAGLAGEFEITKAAKPSRINWWLIGGITGIILLIIIGLVVRRRQLRGY
jgi:uncharacterized repeat protein (TIGR01451 family)